MKNFLTVCLLTLFVAASCSREQSLSGLNEVGSYINEHPEAALAALDSLSSTGEIRGKEANAKFALLYSVALDKNGIDAVDDRLQLLDKFFTAAILDSYEIDKKASKEIEQLVADRDKFLYTTRMTFAAAHPGFIGFLESKGLSEWEIEYCCL